MHCGSDAEYAEITQRTQRGLEIRGIYYVFFALLCVLCVALLRENCFINFGNKTQSIFVVNLFQYTVG